MLSRLFVLLILDLELASLLLRRLAQQATVDTSIWIAIIAGVVGLLTLMIQTYGQIQLASIKQKQEALTSSARDQTKKIEDQAVKLQEVHTVVNSGQSKLIEDVKLLTAKLAELTGEKTERTRADAETLNQKIGAADERSHPTVPTTSVPLTLMTSPPAPGAVSKVEVVNSPNAPVPVKPAPQADGGDKSK